MTDSSSTRGSKTADAILWVLLTLGIAINVMGQLSGMPESVTLSAGIGALLCGAALVALALNRRRS
jgi:membrane associated rhomboid family serine protease